MVIRYDAIIIGAGAAGFMAAVETAKAGLKVLLIDHSQKIGEKIRISGGGRCNFTNINAGPDNYISENPNFCRSALAGYKPDDFIKLVEKHGIKYHEKKLGQLFCNGSSQEITDMLFTEAEDAGVEILHPCIVKNIKPGFILETSHGEFKTKSLVIATGGLSIPQIGASNFAYKIAEEFGHNIISPKAALVPLVLKSKLFEELAGLSFDAEVSSAKTKFRENILFTHKGLSGPAILQISSYWKPGQEIKINLCPELDLKTYLLEQKDSENSKKKLKSILKDIKMPEGLNKELKTKLNRENIFTDKFIDKWSETYDLDKITAEYSNKKLEEIAQSLNSWTLIPDTDEGYDKAEVTAGGIDTKELDSKTMESKKVPGLYFIGEAVDVTGWLGGYNFQWAWASGYAAGTALKNNHAFAP